MQKLIQNLTNGRDKSTLITRASLMGVGLTIQGLANQVSTLVSPDWQPRAHAATMLTGGAVMCLALLFGHGDPNEPTPPTAPPTA